MTQNTLPLATPIPHHLATELLDKSANNWPLWEKRVLSCLTIVGLEGYVVGAVPCPADPVGAMNWHNNDRAVVSFLILKASRTEQDYIAPYAAAGAKAVWDALITRHCDVTLQIRLLREAFSVRYGAEPPAVTSARIDALATRILALGQINKATLISAMMVNAVQGDLENFTSERRRASNLGRPQDLESSAEQAAISAIATERSTIEHVLLPAVSAFLQLTPDSDEAEWTRLMEQLFQVLGRLDAIAIAPGWDKAYSAKQNAIAEIQKLQNNLEATPAVATGEDDHTNFPQVSEAERIALASIAAEMTKVRDELAPAVSDYLLQEPDDTQRKSLIQLLVQSLMRLHNTAMQPDWQGRIARKRAVEEVLRLLNTLEWKPASESSAGPSHSIGRHEQVMIALIASEMSNVQQVLAPAVATFPRSAPQQSDEREFRDLSKSLFETVQRLDSTHINLDWEQARKDKKDVIRAVEKLQNQLDALPSSTEEQDAIEKTEAERSKVQFLLFPAVTAYVANPIERERLRLSDLLLQVLKRFEAISLQPVWNKAKAQRKDALDEVQRLLDHLAPKPPPSYPPTQEQTTAQGEEQARSLLVSERSKIHLLSLAVQYYVKKPNEKERARLSELLLQALERLDGIAMEPGWEGCRQDRRNAVVEAQKLQDMLDAAIPRS
ncbi:hypothetical protein C8R45DRAFT_105517 [Mycena sanguinolenta]|nr:hypothetical protein C8R45DRAFT_105517 [Mycena sanguinolenta]